MEFGTDDGTRGLPYQMVDTRVSGTLKQIPTNFLMNNNNISNTLVPEIQDPIPNNHIANRYIDTRSYLDPRVYIPNLEGQRFETDVPASIITNIESVGHIEPRAIIMQLRRRYGNNNLLDTQLFRRDTSMTRDAGMILSNDQPTDKAPQRHNRPS